jgi:ubiquinone/menaquinone biosynthesis C-methylase UbiE
MLVASRARGTRRSNHADSLDMVGDVIVWTRIRPGDSRYNRGMNSDSAFTGSIPTLYDRHLSALLFTPYADDLATRVRALAPRRLLEVAAGTGVVTRALAAAVPECAIMATDLNQPMIDYAAAHTHARNVTWRQADAQALPFGDGELDVVVCQFGAMFVPDKPLAFREARRVLREGGRYLFSVWDSLEHNELPRAVVEALDARFPDDPPQFLRRTPYGHHDADTIARALVEARFQSVASETVTLRGRGTAEDAAMGLCAGCPTAPEIEARAPGRLREVTSEIAAAVARRVGDGEVDGRLQAFVFSATR